MFVKSFLFIFYVILIFTLQKQAWPDHKRECKCLQRLQPRIPTDSVRLVARIIFKLLSQSKSDQEVLYSIAEHQSHLVDMSEEKKEGLGHLCTTLQVYLGEEYCSLSELPSDLDPISLLARVSVLSLSSPAVSRGHALRAVGRHTGSHAALRMVSACHKCVDTY
ncbi:Histone-lysine N-methyltransferase SMYD3 [Anabarilius grahami]|uniref:Histone-lysine N-methyltransferase SMYD3 n=1 Tax=Anabarilius grahami TaxID=495550 RepID=A0A3N0XWY7_ANAGA|nr:Histone-lysine N-methyltransferase SMYD3 [Anabarilius grahami]